LKRCINPTQATVSRIEKGDEPMYETPDIIHEGDLEVQAGSPVGMPGLDDLEEW
jgi:hypothetical protein